MRRTSSFKLAVLKVVTHLSAKKSRYLDIIFNFVKHFIPPCSGVTLYFPKKISAFLSCGYFNSCTPATNKNPNMRKSKRRKKKFNFTAKKVHTKQLRMTTSSCRTCLAAAFFRTVVLLHSGTYLLAHSFCMSYRKIFTKLNFVA